MEDRDQALADIIAANINSMLKQTRISLIGLAFGTEISLNHLRTITKGQASISTKTAGKIANIFQIQISALFSPAPIDLGDIDDIPNIRAFYIQNKNNPKFFEGRKSETGVAYFVRTEMLNNNYFEEPLEVYQVIDIAKKDFKKVLGSKQTSLALNRMVDSGELEKEVKATNKGTNLYRRKKP